MGRDVKERDHLEYRGVDGWIILQWELNGTDWNNLVEDRNKWWAVVKPVMNLSVP